MTVRVTENFGLSGTEYCRPRDDVESFTQATAFSAPLPGSWCPAGAVAAPWPTAGTDTRPRRGKTVLTGLPTHLDGAGNPVGTIRHSGYPPDGTASEQPRNAFTQRSSPGQNRSPSAVMRLKSAVNAGVVAFRHRRQGTEAC